ncbi:Eco57I restriction-modification methylase domain-containing protein [Clostridium lundense]|uniref:Eco57I restriction-modification methylase domain-containing protein n=1 Tax=Clostridium lundense TaxID=319475 RepID=UPI00048806A4|nr:N-6 DNA methylase [Clostridium lundense]
MADKISLKANVSKIREILIKDFASKFEKLGFDNKGNISIDIPMSNQDMLMKNNLVSLFESKNISGNQKEFIKYIQDCARTFLHILICFKTMEKRQLMGKLLKEIIANNIYNEVLPDFKNVDPYAFMDIVDKYEDEIDDLERKDNYKEDTEYYKFILVLQVLSKEMAKEVPLLFKDFEHTILYPDFESIKAIINILSSIKDEEFYEDDFLGWIYQYWVDVKADEIKIAKNNEDISYKDKIYSLIINELEEEQTQFGEFYTPRWVVKYIVDNTLKPYWEENKNIDNIKLLDPACGAGNFLVYSFDVFYELYKAERPEYSEETIVKKILENNIFGVDIQREPLQISALNLWLKAKGKAADAKITEMKLFNMNILKANSLYRYENDIVTYQISLFDQDIDFNENTYTAEDIGKYISNQEKIFQRKAKDFFSQKFEVIVMNPPYLGIRKMRKETSDFLKKQYPKYYNNLFEAFIARAEELLIKNGCLSFVGSDSFMTLDSHDKIRELMLSNFAIRRLIKLGVGVFDGPAVSAALFLAFKSNKNSKQLVECCDLTQNTGIQDIDSVEWVKVQQKLFNNISGSPFIFDIPTNIWKIFIECKKLVEEVKIKQGIMTGDNGKYLRYKWEIPDSYINKHFFAYAKGGGYSKYSNDLYDYINWYNDGYEIKKEAKEKYGSETRTIKNQEFFFKPGLTYSNIGGKYFSVRNLPSNCIFDMKGSCIFSDNDNLDYILGFLNSKLTSFILYKLNPSPGFQVGDLERVPYKKPKKEVEEKVKEKTIKAKEIKEFLLGFNYISDFYHSTELEFGFNYCNKNIADAYIQYLNYAEKIENELYEIQNDIDKCIYKIYDLSNLDIEVIEEEFGKSAYNYEKLTNPSDKLSRDELQQLYCIGDPKKESRSQRPMSIIEIAEYKGMNPDDVLELRKEYGIYREKDLKQAVLNWLRAIVKDYIKEQEPKLYLDEDIEKIIRIQIEKNFKNGYELINEAEAILEKSLIGVIRSGVKIGSSNVTIAGKGAKDLDEPLLQQKVISGTGASKTIVIWHLQQFLLEFEEDKKYVMQNEIRRIKELLESRLRNCKEKLLAENIKAKDKKELEKEEKLLVEGIKVLDNWKVV